MGGQQQSFSRVEPGSALIYNGTKSNILLVKYSDADVTQMQADHSVRGWTEKLKPGRGRDA